MFVDRVTLYVKGGNGGDGCVAFRHEFRMPKGGPSGGDGGSGGSVILKAERNVDSLAAMSGTKHFRAENGRPGAGALKSGKSGDDLVIAVPCGTLVKDADLGHVIKDLTQEGDEFVVAAGGRGGRGNKRFATSIDRAPRESEPGAKGEERHITLELKVIADVGLVGKPNAGKSTLLSRLSRAHPEIADYPFTTKYPNLGIVQIGFDHSFVMADIPGLIEGASEGVGLGHEFLRHVERTKIFIHLVEPCPTDGTDPIDNYVKIREELRLYNEDLWNRPEFIAVTKCEMAGADDIAQQLRDKTGRTVVTISSVTGRNLPQLVAAVNNELLAIREAEREAAQFAQAIANKAREEAAASGVSVPPDAV